MSMRDEIQNLRQHGAFPGAFANILDTIDSRLTALEIGAANHGPMLADMKTGWDEHQAAIAEAAADREAEAAATPNAPAPPPGGNA